MMLSFDPTISLWTLSIVQLLGIASAWLTRLSEGSAHQTRCQRIFLLSLLLMGAATIAALRLQPVYWLAPAVTLALMIIVVVCDFSRSGRSEYSASGL
jgi:hypothetical protein